MSTGFALILSKAYTYAVFQNYSKDFFGLSATDF